MMTALIARNTTNPTKKDQVRHGCTPALHQSAHILYVDKASMPGGKHRQRMSWRVFCTCMLHPVP